MILQSLMRLAEREGLLADPGFEQKDVAWVVDIDAGGNILAITGPELDPETRKPRPRPMPVPRRRTRGGTANVPDCLVDKAEYVFGIGDPDAQGPKAKKSREQAVARQAAMLAEVEQIAAKTGDPGAKAQSKAMHRVLADPAQLERAWSRGDEDLVAVPIGVSGQIQAPKRWVKNRSSLFLFRYDDTPVCRSRAVAAEVKRCMAPAEPDQAGSGELCLVTGEWAAPVDSHPEFPLPGGTKGLPLVSFNCQAFEHYGRERNENAPVSQAAADAVVQALRRLTDTRFRHPETGATMPPRSLRLADATTVLYWTEVDTAGDDPLDALLLGECLEAPETQLQRLRSIYQSPRSGSIPALIDDPTRFFTLVLTREKSRVVVRSATLHTIADVTRSLLRYFDDLEITPRVAGEREARGLPQLLRATQSTKARESHVPADLASRLYQSAISGAAFPPELLAAVLRRIRSQDDAGVSTSRVALLKATLKRAYGKEVPVSLQKDYPSTAYHLGRLFAVLENAQDKATKAQAGIAERFLGSALASPALVFPRLLKLSHHHLAKIGGGLEHNFRQLIDDIVACLPPELSRTQALVEQGTFMVGYHHQRAAMPEALRSQKQDAPASESLVSSEGDR